MRNERGLLIAQRAEHAELAARKETLARHVEELTAEDQEKAGRSWRQLPPRFPGRRSNLPICSERCLAPTKNFSPFVRRCKP